MVDMDLLTVTAIVSNLSSFLSDASEAAKDSTDLSLKVAINKAYTEMHRLSAAATELAKENQQLKEKLAQKDSVKRTSEFGYYFKDGDPDPLCPKCYEGDGKLAYLGKVLKDNDGGLRRWCNQCEKSFYEARPRAGHIPPSYNPYDWMG